MISSKCCICFTTDAGFLLPTLVSAIQARANSSRALADVLIFCFGSDVETYRKFASICAAERIQLVAVDPDQIEHAEIVYARLFLHRFVPAEYSELLFMDGDLQIRGDLDPLIEQVLPPGHFCAAADPMYFNPPSGPGPRATVEHISSKLTYFNAGVLRINRIGWAEVSEQAFTYSTLTRPELCPFKDQDGLNFIAKSRHIPISMKWNFPIFMRNCCVERNVKPRIYHFMSHPKPWQGNFPPWNRSFTLPYLAVAKKYPWLTSHNARPALGFQIRYAFQQRYKQMAETVTWGMGSKRKWILDYEAAMVL